MSTQTQKKWMIQSLFFHHSAVTTTTTTATLVGSHTAVTATESKYEIPVTINMCQCYESDFFSIMMLIPAFCR